MNVASQGLCQELYELSGWSDTRDAFFNSAGGWTWTDFGEETAAGALRDEPGDWLPAYDLGYLVRKLMGHSIYKLGSGSYEAHWRDHAPTKNQVFTGQDHITCTSKNSPENALCSLAIELFKKDLLSKFEDNDN